MVATRRIDAGLGAAVVLFLWAGGATILLGLGALQVAEVRAVAKGLVAGGVRPGDRVALISRTRYEWTLIDFATWFAAATTSPARFMS